MATRLQKNWLQITSQNFMLTASQQCHVVAFNCKVLLVQFLFLPSSKCLKGTIKIKTVNRNTTDPRDFCSLLVNILILKYTIHSTHFNNESTKTSSKILRVGGNKCAISTGWL